MHILLIHQAFAAMNEPGGTRHHEFARYLTSQGHKVTVIASPVSYLTGGKDAAKAPRRESADDITILRTYTYSALHKSFVHRVFSFFSFMVSSFWAGMQVKDVDVVWGTSPPIFQGVTAWAISRLKRVPFLLEIRDLWPAFAVQVGVLTNPVLIRMSEWLERFLYRHADQVMVNSPGFIEHVTARGAKKVELVPNGADTAMFDPDAHGENFRERHQLGDAVIALYAGAHGMSNDLGVVLATASKLKDEPNLCIVLLGDGKEKERLKEQAAEMQLTNVVFIDSIPKTAMPEALAAADMCIGILKPIPLYGTVYPNKIFDYMAAARPVVLAMEGEIKTVVEDANAGIYTPPGDADSLARAIRTLANDPDLRRSMGESGRRAVQNQFDRPILAEKLHQLLVQIDKMK